MDLVFNYIDVVGTVGTYLFFNEIESSLSRAHPSTLSASDSIGAMGNTVSCGPACEFCLVEGQHCLPLPLH